jgi:GT2 family glycosyltransferase/glycosyltransferase involved in cell wall biosynthesis
MPAQTDTPIGPGADVVVPIYGAADDLARCLASVTAHTDLERHGLILVIDGPQDDAVEQVLRSHARAQVLRNNVRCGFVVSVNRGMAASTRDVVLLNSDTIVTPRWLEKIIAASASDARIGTVTPLSNNASLCSVPRTLVENLLPAGFDAVSMAALVERVSLRAYVHLPTAIGFCMWIRRTLLQAIGAFDAARFGLGYGEENDFCLRASAQGWVHIADDATFIQHAGHRSFRAERLALQRRARRTLSRMHPDYLPSIARFMAEDPLAPVRARINAAIRLSARSTAQSHRPPSPIEHVVHLLHGWPPLAVAGTETYARGLVQRQLQWREVSVYARLEDAARAQREAVELNDNGARVRLLTNNFTQRNPLARNAISESAMASDFEHFLREQRPRLVHIHHLAGHSFTMAKVAHRFGVPIVFQIQDWWALCASANLHDASGQRCSGPALAKCARCMPLTGIAPVPIWSSALHWVRGTAARRALGFADAYVMGSEFIRNDYERAALFAPCRPVFVLPYGVDVPAPALPRSPTRHPVRFGFVGSALPHKGLAIATEAFRDVDPALATLQIWGSAGQRFADADRAQVYASMDVLIVPSIGLESFGLVAREAMASGVPVIATRDGALLEMAAEFFPSGDAAALRAVILRLAQNPHQVDALSRSIIAPKSADTHAEEIEAVYAAVIKARQ